MLISNVILKKLRVVIKVVIEVKMLHTLKNMKIIFLAVLLVCIDDNFSKPIVLDRGENAVYKFIEAIFKEYDYYEKVIEKYFNKNLVVSAEDEERSWLSNKCWICDKLFDVGDDKVRDHCHITGKYRGQAHLRCNVNLTLTKTVTVIFDNLEGQGSHLIMQGIKKFHGKLHAIPNGLEKYMAFAINNNLVFIDSKNK